MKDDTVCGALSPKSSRVSGPRLVRTVAFQVRPCARVFAGASAYCLALFVGVGLLAELGDEVAGVDDDAELEAGFPAVALVDGPSSAWLSAKTPPITTRTASTA